MKFKPLKRMPVVLALSVIVLVGVVRCLDWDLFERLERMTYDWRVRAALHFPAPAATNLGFVYIDEESVKAVWNGSLGFNFGLLWPRQVYGRLVDELAAQGAKAVGIDILFGELRHDQAEVKMSDGHTFMESDDYFAMSMRHAGNVIIAITPDITPPNLFLTNAAMVGDITADTDSDGVLRRAKAFRVYRRWHEAFRKVEDDPDYDVDLSKARIGPRQIILPRPAELGNITVPLDANGNFDLADFGGDKLPPGQPRFAKPFTDERVWHMGIALAARELGLDLEHPEVDRGNGRITLHGRGGITRVIPVDADGYFYIDWSLLPNSPQLTRQSIQAMLAQARRRLEGQTNGLEAPWRGKLVVVGSSAVVGNNLTDLGATPLMRHALLVAKHWNVANSVITGRFVRRAPLPMELALIAMLGLLAAVMTWQLRVLAASASVLAVAVIYLGFALGLYVHSRFWLPLVLPIGGALFMNYVCLVSWRVVFEQAEQRRIKGVFSMVVSPKIVKELLQASTLALGGARREITVLFADVRGFTELTDDSQEQVAERVRRAGLTGAAAEACFDQQARETLATINLYLSVVADTVIEQDGTLDKFIGDCVMAFWGAPTPNPRHAASCVRAAVQAQRAIYDLNLRRLAENKRHIEANEARMANGLPPEPLLPILFLGTGINTGWATVGLMGAESRTAIRQGSYTVFGREVNLASRLEGRSGRGRILISQGTFAQLQRDDPALAATCIALPVISDIKGIRGSIQAYEVPWRAVGALPLDVEFGERRA